MVVRVYEESQSSFPGEQIMSSDARFTWGWQKFVTPRAQGEDSEIGVTSTGHGPHCSL